MIDLGKNLSRPDSARVVADVIRKQVGRRARLVRAKMIVEIPVPILRVRKLRNQSERVPMGCARTVRWNAALSVLLEIFCQLSDHVARR